MRLILLLLLLTLPTVAVTTLEQEFSCPLCAATWKQRMETSSSPTGMRLDLRQLGDVVQPPTLPQCTKCRLVLFMPEFDEKLTAALRPFVQRDDFRVLAEKYSSYYALALLQEHLKAPPLFIGHSYLRASWQLEAKPALARQCLSAAYEQLAAAHRSLEPTDKKFANTTLLLGELERRLGRWDEADARFRGLLDAEGFKDPASRRIVSRQMELIAKRDDAPRAILPEDDAAPVARTVPAKPTDAPQRFADPLPMSLDAISERARPAPARPKPKARPLITTP